MALDGITIAALRNEMTDRLIEGRISKIAQPESDELLLTIKRQKDTYKLLLSASPSLPLAYFTEQTKPNPATAPNFCMLLRKHIGNGRIVNIVQPDFERILDMEIEHLDEMGDLQSKHLIIELMGKHSNIIFCDSSYRIIDSIKHISAQVSSVREVLPGREYFIPKTTHKYDPLNISDYDFTVSLMSCPHSIGKALYTTLTGISPVIASEICHRAGVDESIPAGQLSEVEMLHLYRTFSYLMEEVATGRFVPRIYYQEEMPVEYAAILLTCYKRLAQTSFESISELLEEYYASRNAITRIRQKSSDLRRIVQTALERSVKKYDLQRRQMKDTEKREKFRIYGELVNAFGYSMEPGAKELVAENYYDNNKEVHIPIDPELSVGENAKRYYDKYGKLKRTWEALGKYMKESQDEIEHLRSISTALDIAMDENDLAQIKEELREYGYIHKRGPKDKKSKITSRPFHYMVGDFHIYIGKNNYQNEEVTFKIATGNDWWFHAKGIPGSHVIVKTEGRELPDHIFEIAAGLAAWYSSERGSQKVEIDYVQKKQVKKVPSSKPGFVIYHTNYSMVAKPSLKGAVELD